MNKINPIGPSFLNLNYPNNFGASGPFASYNQVYERSPENVNEQLKLFDVGLIKEIKSVLENKKAAGTKSISISGTWEQLPNKEVEKIIIFNDSEEDLEIKQLEFSPLVNYTHSRKLEQEEILDTLNPLFKATQFVGDFRTQVTSQGFTNSPFANKHAFAYAKLPQDFDTKEWSVSFDAATSAPQGWTGWDSSTRLGEGFVFTIFNNWKHNPSPIGLFTNFYAPLSEVVANDWRAEDTSNGYSFYIEDQPDVSDQIKYLSFNTPLVTGIQRISGCEFRIMTSGLTNVNNIGPTGTLTWNGPSLPISLSIDSNNLIVSNLTTSVNCGLNLTSGFTTAGSLVVRRSVPDGTGNFKIVNFTSFFNARSLGNNSYAVSQSTTNLGNVSSSGVGPIHFYWGNSAIGTLPWTNNVDAPNYSSFRNYKIDQSAGVFRIYVKDNNQTYVKLTEFYDRAYHARSKMGNYIGFGALIGTNSFADHNIKNVYINGQRTDLIDGSAKTLALNSSTSLNLAPNTAIELEGLTNLNQIFLKRKDGENQPLPIKYRWEI